eukprot:8972341-Pyramimonas_sp.AAC.1
MRFHRIRRAAQQSAQPNKDHAESIGIAGNRKAYIGSNRDQWETNETHKHNPQAKPALFTIYR